MHQLMQREERIQECLSKSIRHRKNNISRSIGPVPSETVFCCILSQHPCSINRSYTHTIIFCNGGPPATGPGRHVVSSWTGIREGGWSEGLSTCGRPRSRHGRRAALHPLLRGHARGVCPYLSGRHWQIAQVRLREFLYSGGWSVNMQRHQDNTHHLPECRSSHRRTRATFQ